MKFALTQVVILALLTRCRLVSFYICVLLSSTHNTDPFPQGLTTPVAVAVSAPGPISADAITPATLGNAVFVPLQYIGPITPGGDDVVLNGTAQVRIPLPSFLPPSSPCFRPSELKTPS